MFCSYKSSRDYSVNLGIIFVYFNDLCFLLGELKIVDKGYDFYP